MSFYRDQTTLQATNYFIQGQLEASIKLYSQLLSETLDYNLFINRCVAYIFQNDYSNSLNDANSAIEITPQKYEGYFYKGISLISIGKIEDALINFNEAIQKNIPENIIRKWLFRCNSELSNKKIKSIERHNQNQEEKKEPFPPRHHIYSKTGKLAYTWFQTDKIIGMTLNYRINDRKLLKYKLEETTLEVSFPINGSKVYNLQINLWGVINPDASKVLPNLETIDITLEKKLQKQNWEHLAKDGGNYNEDKLHANEDKVPLYPTSAHQKKDWNKIDKELEEEIRKDQELYGDARKGLIEALYNNSNDEQRRALAKSVQGSKGCYM